MRPDDLAEHRKWVRLHGHNEYQAEAARRITALVDALERSDRRRRDREADVLRWQGWHAELASDHIRLAATVDRVRALHRPVEIEPSATICGHCSYRLPNGHYFGKVEEWPCPTIAAIEGTDS